LENSFSHSPKEFFCLLSLFFSQLHILAPCPPPSIPLKAWHQSLPRTVTHTPHKVFQLSSKDLAPSPKPTHLSHSIITCKTTNKAKIRKTSNWNFNVLEAQQLWHQLPHSWIRVPVFIYPQKMLDTVCRSQWAWLIMPLRFFMLQFMVIVGFGCKGHVAWDECQRWMCWRELIEGYLSSPMY
jgi:hypothetical protein